MYNPVGPVMTFSSAKELTGIDAMKGLKARRLLKSEEPMWDALVQTEYHYLLVKFILHYKLE